jgi:hypothetical protein
MHYLIHAPKPFKTIRYQFVIYFATNVVLMKHRPIEIASLENVVSLQHSPIASRDF